MNLFDLSGRVALVTGGNGGIGLGMAKGLAAAGAAVMIAGRNRDKSEAAVAALRRAGGTAESVITDVADETSCRNMVAATLTMLGRLDALINNAGIGVGKRPEQLTVAEWNEVLATNLTGALIAAQAAYPEMKRQGGGKIINIGSMFSIFGAWFSAAYGASKGGIVQHKPSFRVGRRALTYRSTAPAPLAGHLRTAAAAISFSRPTTIWSLLGQADQNLALCSASASTSRASSSGVMIGKRARSAPRNMPSVAASMRLASRAGAAFAVRQKARRAASPTSQFDATSADRPELGDVILPNAPWRVGSRPGGRTGGRMGADINDSEYPARSTARTS